MKHRKKTKQELQDAARVDEALAEAFPASGASSGAPDVEPRRAQGFMRPDELKWTAIGGDKPMKHETEKTASSFLYLAGGFVLGAVCGLLLAPKKGSELIAGIGDWGRGTKVRGAELYSKAKEYIPHRAREKTDESRS